MKRVFLICFLAFSYSCPAGHFEKGPSLTLDEAGQKKILIVPEYEKTWKVIVSDMILWPDGVAYPVDHGRSVQNNGIQNLDFIKAVLETGTGLIVITDSKRKPRVMDVVNDNNLTGISYLQTDLRLNKESVNYVYNNFVGTKAQRAGFHPRRIPGEILPELKQDAFRLIVELRTTGHPFSRDYTPVFAMTTEGRYRLLDHNFDVARPVSDHVPLMFANMWNDNADRLAIPLYNVGGNLSCDREECFMADFVVRENSQKSINSKLAYYPDDKIHTKQQILDLYGNIAFQKFEILDSLPIEFTGHIDVWFRHVGEKTLMIATLSDETIATDPRVASNRHLKKSLEEISDFLVKKRNEFRSRGYKVISVPMPLPMLPDNYKHIAAKAAGLDVYKLYENPETGKYFYSYVNSLLIKNQQGKRTAIVPRYRTTLVASDLGPGVEHYDQHLFGNPEIEGSYEQLVEAAYKGAGYAVRWVNCDWIVTEGGSVHCSTMQIPYTFRYRLPESEIKNENQ